uniref:VWFD domain-containing protein n=1 Tax=Anolis carolinensis TaxID=28377 RepID=A0A803SUL8_ANOCA
FRWGSLVQTERNQCMLSSEASHVAYGSMGGEASTWGKGLYKTFDNCVFSFESFCKFTFCRHCVESGREFNIEMTRNKNGKIDRIAIHFPTFDLNLNNIFIYSVQLPFDNKMVHIKKYGDYTKLESRRGILTLLWNNEDKFSIMLHKKYETCGLCGSLHAGRGKHILQNYCHDIISKYFKSCKTVGNLYHEYEKLCTEEYCKTGSGMDVCSTFLELARKCSSEGSGPFEAWRRDPDVICESKIYRDCGPSNPATCSYMSLYQDAGCVSGCVCPEGYVVDDIEENGKCIKKRKCPCKFDGKVYRPGEKRKGPCNSECKHLHQNKYFLPFLFPPTHPHESKSCKITQECKGCNLFLLNKLVMPQNTEYFSVVLQPFKTWSSNWPVIAYIPPTLFKICIFVRFKAL